MKNWELVRCVYDYDSYYIEIEDPKQCRRLIEEEGYQVSYMIGEKFQSGEHTCVHVILEGRKDYLEQVLAWRDKWALNG